MKTTFLKKLMPLAVFVLGIAGAFSTVSWQSTADADVLPIFGYVDNNDGGSPCDIQINCDTEEGDICRLTADENSPKAWAKLPGETTTCSREVYRPD